jgi:hypothetical protein
MHLTTIFGGFVANALNRVGPLIMLVALKTGIDFPDDTQSEKAAKGLASVRRSAR